MLLRNDILPGYINAKCILLIIITIFILLYFILRFINYSFKNLITVIVQINLAGINVRRILLISFLTRLIYYLQYLRFTERQF